MALKRPKWQAQTHHTSPHQKQLVTPAPSWHTFPIDPPTPAEEQEHMGRMMYGSPTPDELTLDFDYNDANFKHVGIEAQDISAVNLKRKHASLQIDGSECGSDFNAVNKEGDTMVEKEIVGAH
ncbi:hypothetical protein M404DRAFT_9298 [Pisolithus tinctorius Marx 270]|uniref:Uncharacterized protein n=1 Tax=Pisolithus tinctorius Marx 270 TaxID=870435 RepID=A0A0C3J530_PISTI|nr:hypothetical protein M404DRAFT_9298 [Pisolithus tinctorius Marx 270]